MLAVIHLFSFHCLLRLYSGTALLTMIMFWNPLRSLAKLCGTRAAVRFHSNVERICNSVLKSPLVHEAFGELLISLFKLLKA